MENTNKYWDVLNIRGNQHNKEIAIAFLESEHCGIQEGDESFYIYFENPNRKNIENILNNKTKITKWNWDKISLVGQTC